MVEKPNLQNFSWSQVLHHRELTAEQVLDQGHHAPRRKLSKSAQRSVSPGTRTGKTELFL